MTRTYTTDLRCGACVEGIRPVFDRAPGIARWSVDLTAPGKPITVEGDRADRAHVQELLAQKGYRILADATPTPAPTPAEPPTSLYPLALIVAYLVGIVLVVEWSHGRFHAMHAMRNFMAGFFLTFSFFKLLDLRAFADSYAMYDLLAARSRAYALAYPFLELGLGVAYLLDAFPTPTNAFALGLMLVGMAGVGRSLLAKRKIRCACLGAVLQLPMTFVTLAEDGLMAAMAAFALFA